MAEMKWLSNWKFWVLFFIFSIILMGISPEPTYVDLWGFMGYLVGSFISVIVASSGVYFIYHRIKIAFKKP